jgi:hypothetical protein
LLKILKKFRPFILGKHAQVKVPLPTVKKFLSQAHLSRKFAHWLTKIQEHDFMITTSNSINGFDLALYLAQHPKLGYPSKNNEDAFSTLFLIEYGNIDLATHPQY